MIIETYSESYERLTPIQKEAVEWGEGPALVLAGPGAGKTKVLTTRIARLLNESPKRKFRVLALTFTTKAAAEMTERVEAYAPEASSQRIVVGTFHGFCAQILAQHGSHIGMRPDFGICENAGDRHAIIEEALLEAQARGESVSKRDADWLKAIERLKRDLVSPEKAAKKHLDPRLVRAYELYEAKLKSENIMDFNGLIMEACRLFAKNPAVAKQVREAYPYWLLDEFQDTSTAQYWLLHYMAAGEFRNIFAVADDDQIIFQWAGASYRQIERFRTDYKPVLIQLVENHRCPAVVVRLANKLVAFNTQRIPEKQETKSVKPDQDGSVQVREFDSEDDEREFVAESLKRLGKNEWGNSAVLARNRALLNLTSQSLQRAGIQAANLQRREEFVTPQFRWLQMLLTAVVRPLDKRAFTVLVNVGNEFLESELDPLLLTAEAEGLGTSYLHQWIKVQESCSSPISRSLATRGKSLESSSLRWTKIVSSLIEDLSRTVPTQEGVVSDFDEDQSAWKNCIKEIRTEMGTTLSLSDLVLGISLRSKLPPVPPNTVSLLTIHGAKGLEYDVVFLIGSADEEMPAWQSIQKGADSSEMEEERRNCFVAITRVKKRLVITWAKAYRGRPRTPSRFLKEMELAAEIK